MSDLTCAVRGCTNLREAVFTSSELMAEYAVCAFHFHALSEGERWTESSDTRHPEILMGADMPPLLIDGTWLLDDGALHKHLTLQLHVGRDGVTEDTFTFSVDAEGAADLIAVLQRVLGRRD